MSSAEGQARPHRQVARRRATTPILTIAMVTLGGVIGALIAIAILFGFIEWSTADLVPHDVWVDGVLILLATILGWSAGTRLARVFVKRRST